MVSETELYSVTYCAVLFYRLGADRQRAGDGPVRAPLGFAHQIGTDKASRIAVVTVGVPSIARGSLVRLTGRALTREKKQRAAILDGMAALSSLSLSSCPKSRSSTAPV